MRPPWNKLVKRGVYKNVLFPETTFSEDRAIMTQALYYTKNIDYVNEGFYHWCVIPNSACRNHNRYLTNIIEDYVSYITILLFINDKKPDCIDEYRKEINRHINCLGLLCSNNKKILDLYKMSFNGIIKTLKMNNSNAREYAEKEISKIKTEFVVLD